MEMAVRTRITEKDTDERKSSTGNQALVLLLVLLTDGGASVSTATLFSLAATSSAVHRS